MMTPHHPRTGGNLLSPPSRVLLYLVLPELSRGRSRHRYRMSIDRIWEIASEYGAIAEATVFLGQNGVTLKKEDRRSLCRLPFIQLPHRKRNILERAVPILESAMRHDPTVVVMVTRQKIPELLVDALRRANSRIVILTPEPDLSNLPFVDEMQCLRDVARSKELGPPPAKSAVRLIMRRGDASGTFASKTAKSA